MKRWLLTSLVSASLIFGGLAARPSGVAASQPIANCRYGITVTDNAARFDLPALGVGGYLDWRQSPATPVPAGLDYIHMVRLRGSKRQFVYDPSGSDLTAQFEGSLRTAVENYPGQAWLVGNEPDTSFENQDALTPDQYALAYHNVYNLIKSADSAAQVGIGTIVEPTPLRLQWLEAVWAAYANRYHAKPPSDFWSIHSFILREKPGDWGTGIPPGLNATSGELYTLAQTDNLAIFSQRLVDFRGWLARHGERYKPLWITEYGSLLPQDPRAGLVTEPAEQARDYMLGTFKFLTSAADSATGYPYDGNHLVQRWFWYSLDDDLARFGGSLYDPATGQPTLIGNSFATYVNDSAPRPDLQLNRPTRGVFGSWPRRSSDPVLVRVTVSNAGSASALFPMSVTWYDGDPDHNGQALSVSTAVGPLAGCGTAMTLSAWLAYPSKPDGQLYARLQSEDLAQPLTLPLSAWQLHAPVLWPRTGP